MPLATTPEIVELKKKHKIPDHYNYACTMGDGRVIFSYCDSDIDVYPDGRCEETHMGYNGTSHQFYTSSWPLT